MVKNWELQHECKIIVLYQNLCYNKVCYEGTALYLDLEHEMGHIMRIHAFLVCEDQPAIYLV